MGLNIIPASLFSLLSAPCSMPFAIPPFPFPHIMTIIIE